MTTIKIVYST